MHASSTLKYKICKHIWDIVQTWIFRYNILTIKFRYNVLNIKLRTKLCVHIACDTNLIWKVLLSKLSIFKMQIKITKFTIKEKLIDSETDIQHLQAGIQDQHSSDWAKGLNFKH